MIPFLANRIDDKDYFVTVLFYSPEIQSFWVSFNDGSMGWIRLDSFTTHWRFYKILPISITGHVITGE